jgi:hypothetical protein
MMPRGNGLKNKADGPQRTKLFRIENRAAFREFRHAAGVSLLCLGIHLARFLKR